MFNGVREPKKTYNVIKLKKGVGRDTETAEANFSRPGPNIYIQASKWLAEIRRITSFVFDTRITPF